MKKSLKVLYLTLLTTSIYLLSSISIAAQSSSDDEIKAQALEQLAYELGRWKTRWETLDADGNVIDVQEGFEIFEELNPPNVYLMTTEITTTGLKTHTLRYFNEQDKMIHMYDVTHQGIHYKLVVDPISGFTEMDPIDLADGREMTIRFKTVEQTDDYMKVSQESSFDGGATWQLSRYQHMERES